MRIVYEKCCGLDVHKRTVVACVRSSDISRRRSEVRTFGTMTADLLKLGDWLVECGCTHVAMESTGVYWKPVFNILESVCEVLLVNAHHIKTLPGRKTDVKDCEWIAELLEHGLLRASFVPPEPIRDLRDLTRYRKTLVRTRTSEVNRVQKVLEGANIKLGNVASDVLGTSGRAMLEALIGGEREEGHLADLARGTLRRKRDDLAKALKGRFTAHHAFLLKQLLSHVDEINKHIAECDEKVAEHMASFEKERELIETIPGVGRRTAEGIVAEVGVDMTRFPTAANLASWAGMCPGHHESAGIRKRGTTRKGNNWLRIVLLEAAWAGARKKQTYGASLYGRISRRRGSKKAAVAVGHHILTSVWHILHKKIPYADLGPQHFDHLNRERLQRHYVRRLEELGVNVTVAATPEVK